MEQTRHDLESLARALLERLTVEVEASGRHVHLSAAHAQALFGHRLTPARPLSQPGQFLCRERVTLVGPKGALEGVAVLGPERRESQVEISMTDAVALGVRPPVRQSGELEGTPGLTLRRGDRLLTLERGLIVARRHIHLTAEDAALFGVADGQRVRLQTLTVRPVVFQGVVVRVSPDYAAAAHLDYDEANACGWRRGDRGLLCP